MSEKQGPSRVKTTGQPCCPMLALGLLSSIHTSLAMFEEPSPGAGGQSFVQGLGHERDTRAGGGCPPSLPRRIGVAGPSSPHWLRYHTMKTQVEHCEYLADLCRRVCDRY